MKGIVSSMVVVIFIGLCACATKKASTVFQLNEFVADPDNGLKYNETKGDMQLTIEYRPKDLVVKQQLEGVDPAEREITKRQYDSLDYFVLRFSKKNREIENSYVSDPARLSDVVHYFSKGILDDVFMMTTADTLRPIDVSYMRTFGMSRASSVMVVFKSYLTHRTGSVDFYFHDSMLDTGRNKFTIRIDDIKSIPALNVDL